MCKVWLSSGARHTTRDPPPVRCQPLENDHHGVRSLSPLVRKIHDKQVDGLMVELCDKVLDGKEEQRDICSIGLKSAILELPMSTGSVAVQKTGSLASCGQSGAACVDRDASAGRKPVRTPSR